MNYEGINGEVTAAGHEQWIDLDSVSWGATRGITAATGTNQNREATSVSINEFTVTKLVDDASPYILKEACIGTGKLVTIALTKTGDKLEKYLEYTLRDVMISGYHVNTDGERPVEVITMSFTKLEQSYTPFDDANKAKASVKNSYDLSTAQMG